MSMNLYPIALASPYVNLSSSQITNPVSNPNPITNPIQKKLTLASSNLPLLTYGGQDP